MRSFKTEWDKELRQAVTQFQAQYPEKSLEDVVRLAIAQVRKQAIEDTIWVTQIVFGKLLA